MKFSKKTLLTLGIAGLVFSLLATSFVSAQTQEQTFPDVTDSHPNSEAITYLKDAAVIEGYPDGTYQPASSINRAEFTKILVGAIADSEEITGSNCFPDVNEQWFAPYICTAQNRGFIDGYPDGSFKPGEKINFSEAAKIIANVFNLPEGETDQDPAIWFREYIEAMENVKAVPLSVEYFDEFVTRDEMAEMIWRLKADIDDKTSRTFAELGGSGLVTVNSCNELADRVENSLSFNYERGGGIEVIMQDAMEMDIAEPTSAPAMKSTSGADSSAESAPTDDYSTTNIQVEGVDEADVIKNDGKYIYLIKGSTIRIIDAYPADQMEELVSFELGAENESFEPTEMYIDGDQLTVIGSKYTYNAAKRVSYAPSWHRTQVFIVDIADRSKPKVDRSVEFEGNYQTSRKIDDNLYLVMNLYADFYPYFGELENNPDVSFADVLPVMKDSSQAEEMPIVSCNGVRIMPKHRTSSLIITAAIPLADTEAQIDRDVIMGSSEKIYASRQNLYVALTDWKGGFMYRDNSSTKLYRFALGDNSIEYQAEGEVPGTVLNQFSMDEFRNYFRIATTVLDYNLQDGVEGGNNVYILDQDLDQVGALEGLAPGEKIYSARFMGDRGYLVTFKRIDPLFVLDLSNAQSPKMLGELKIPGFSDYLHPYDENHLIGFGKDVDPEEVDPNADFVYYDAVRGFKMGLFDVTDPTSPQEKFVEVIGDNGTESELLRNHKALLFDREKGLLAFPITVNESPSELQCRDYTYSTCPEGCTKLCAPSVCTYEDGVKICTTDCDGPDSCIEPSFEQPELAFSGAYVYDIDLESGFTLKGTVSHFSEADMTEMQEQGWISDYERVIERALYIGENLYTISKDMVKANDLDTIEEVNSVELAGDAGRLYYGIPEPMPLIDIAE